MKAGATLHRPRGTEILVCLDQLSSCVREGVRLLALAGEVMGTVLGDWGVADV